MAAGFGKNGKGLIEDITRGKYHPIINLRQVDKRARVGILAGFILLFIIIGASLFSAGRAQEAVFYPSACLGDWTNTDLAVGKPQTLSEEFNYNNSAVYIGGNSDIYCGGFSGSIPADVSLLAVKLKIYWQQSERSLDLQSDFFVETEGQPTDSQSNDSESGLEQEKKGDLSEGELSELDVEVQDSEEQNNVVESSSSTEVSNTEDPSQPVVTSEEGGEGDINMDNSVTPGESFEDVNPPFSFFKVFSIKPTLAQSTVSNVINQTEIQIDQTETKQNEEDRDEGVISQQLDEEAKMEEGDLIEDVPTDEIIVSDDFTSTFVVSGKDEIDIDGEDLLFIIKYSIDGISWQKLAEVSKVDEVNELELPLLSVDDITNLQISIEGVGGNSSQLVFLDALELRVNFTELKQYEKNSLGSGVATKLLDNRVLRNDELSVQFPDREGSFEISVLNNNVVLQQRLVKPAPVSPKIIDGKVLYDSIRPGIDFFVELDKKGLKQQWQ